MRCEMRREVYIVAKEARALSFEDFPRGPHGSQIRTFKSHFTSKPTILSAWIFQQNQLHATYCVVPGSPGFFRDECLGLDEAIFKFARETCDSICLLQQGAKFFAEISWVFKHCITIHFLEREKEEGQGKAYLGSILSVIIDICMKYIVDSTAFWKKIGVGESETGPGSALTKTVYL